MPRIPASTRPTSGASLLKHLAVIVLFLVVAGCSGGGCSSGCSSCGGITPLPNGFDVTKRIENAGSARVTQSGLGFLQANLAALAKGILGATSSNGGIIQFQVPATSTSFSGITANICPNGANPTANPEVCTADIDIGNANLTITPAGPYDIHVTGTIPLRVQDIPVQIGLTVCNPTIDISLNSDGSCTGDASYAQVPIDVDVAIHTDTNMAHAARFGYSQITINKVVDSATLTSALDNDINICNNGGCSGLCCFTDPCGCALGAIANWGPVKNAIIGQLVPSLTNTLSSTIDNQLCQKATATVPCPMGTTPDGSMICRFSDMSCATTLLGTDGNINLGGLLQSISPGTTGGLDFLFAAGGSDINTNDPSMMLHWGDADPVNNGITIGLFGGAEANPLSKCVPMASIPLPTMIPIPDELFQNTIPNWPAGMSGPDVEIALSERFTNYALGSAYNSGLLCIGISTESIPLLSSGALSLFMPSMKTLGLQKEQQQVAIVIRPANPPTVVFGNGTDLTTDPNLLVSLKQVSLDFYIFSLDRFIRFMTATFDLTVPVNLTVSQAGFTPVISTIGVNNGVVTNSQLLKEMPADIASALSSVIGSLVGQQLAGSLKAISLNSSLAKLGLQLTVPPTVMGMGSPGLVKLTKNTDNFLGIYAALGLAMPGMIHHFPTHTHVQVTKKTVDPEGLRFETLRPDNLPVVELAAQSDLEDGTHTVEYQYKIDEGFWHPFQTSRTFVVRDPWMRVQGRHTLYVRSEAVGAPSTLDEENPASVEVVIDADAPEITVSKRDDGRFSIDARDRLTPDPLVRWRVADGAWSEWTLASRAPPVVADDVNLIAVEAKDNEGNVGTLTPELVRGRFDGTSAGCGCTTAGDSGRHGGHALLLLGATLAGLFSRARSRRRNAELLRRARATAAQALAGAALVAVSATWAGCSCGNNNHTMTSGAGGGNSSSHTTSGTGGTGTGGGPSCPTCIELQQGLIGEYTSVAMSGTTLWVAGYNEADWNDGFSYGDLVAGKWDGTKVVWQDVDGVPTTPKVDPTQYDVHGWRGGQTAPGDDVGLWTSIAIGGDTNPAIAYYDRTNNALKFAQYDGKAWASHTVDSGMTMEVGRYAKMLFLGGAFKIAYQSIAPGGTSGALISKVRVATSSSATPTASTSWTFEDAATVNTTPCRAQFCASTEACLSTTKQCTTTLDPSMCMGTCSSSQACVGSPPACVAIWDVNKIDAYPDAIGDYISMAPDGMGGVGLAFYDRTNGNLVMAAKSGGTWATTVVDGESAPTPSGDSGIGTSLFIDTNGDWNITYVNGYTEALQYVKVAKGTTVGTPEIVDDGLSVAGTPNPDGQHLVGDDSHVIVDPGGVVHVTYEDSTAGTLHYAVGTPGSTGHAWQVQALTQAGFAGAFSNIVSLGGKLQLVNFWRVGGKSVVGDVRLVQPM